MKIFIFIIMKKENIRENLKRKHLYIKYYVETNNKKQ